MQLLHLLLLLLATCIATLGAVTAAGDRTSTLQTTKARPHNAEDLKAVSLGNEDVEERGGSIFSKIRSVFGKTNTGTSFKLASMRKNPDVVTALAKSPTVKKLETAAANNPQFFTNLAKDPEALKKLAKNPEVAKAAATLEKSNVKVTTSDIKQLRSAVSKDPAKASKLEEGFLVFEAILEGVIMVGITGLVLFLFVLLIATVAGAFTLTTK